MKHFARLLSVTLLLVAAAGVLAQQEGPLESLLQVFLVERVATEEGVQETLSPTDEAEPGALLEYILTYSNVSEGALRGFVIKNQVPVNTSYVADSSSATVGSSFLVSIDHGATYESEPVTRVVTDADGNEKEIIIPPEQYTAIQWRVEDSLDAGEQMIMKYRVTIN